MNKRLAGKTAIITGASSGIGLATAQLFAQEGAAVVLADINIEAGEAAASQIIDAGGEALFVRTDVSDRASVAALVERTQAYRGSIDVLFNNAGGSTSADGRVTEVSDEEFWRALTLDLYGTWLCSQQVLPVMSEQRRGAVINNASFFALMGWPGRDAYTAAKGGVVALTRSNAVTFAEVGVRVNAIAPGNTRTERSMNLVDITPEFENLPARHPLGVCDPIDIAYGALYLASDEARKVTGQVLAVDGGLTIS